MLKFPVEQELGLLHCGVLAAVGERWRRDGSGSVWPAKLSPHPGFCEARSSPLHHVAGPGEENCLVASG